MKVTDVFTGYSVAKFVIQCYLLVLFLSSATAFSNQQDDDEVESSTFKITILKESEHVPCKETAKIGDQVFIRQKGWRTDTNQLIDQSGKDPLVIQKLGNGRVLKGMEKAIIDMCVGEIISVNIPPNMAFYQPGKQFQRLPIPNFVDVKYQIELVKVVKRGGYLDQLIHDLFKNPFLWFLLILLGLLSKMIYDLLHQRSLNDSNTNESGRTGGGNRDRGGTRGRGGENSRHLKTARHRN